VYLEGKITNRSWDDKDGNKKYMTEIVCSEMKMLGGKNEQSENKSEPKERKTAADTVNERSSASQSAPAETFSDDLPF
jgi:single-strand DNA-binding protein